MLWLKTHYDQVPIEVVRKIVEQQMLRDPTIEPEQEIRKKTLDEDLLTEQQQTVLGSRAFSERES